MRIPSLVQAWRNQVTDRQTAPISTPAGRPPRRRTPPKQPSHWARNTTIAVVGVFVVLAAVGSAASRDASTVGPTAPPDVIASVDGVAEPSESTSPTPGSDRLLSIKGTGPTTSDPFHASGTSVDVSYSYTCSTEDAFGINFYGAGVSPLLPDVLASEFGTTGSDTVNEPLNGTTGPFTVEVDSACDWTVEVTGTP